MKRIEEKAWRAVRQANGLSAGFRYFDNPYDGKTGTCPLCGKTITAGLETCPECGKTILSQRHSREHIRSSLGTILMIIFLAAVIGLGLYFFVREMIASGFVDLLLGQ